MTFWSASSNAITPALKFARDGTREALAGGGDQITADRSVDVQINRLRRKIESDLTNPRWLMTVRGQGYRLATEP